MEIHFILESLWLCGPLHYVRVQVRASVVNLGPPLDLKATSNAVEVSLRLELQKSSFTNYTPPNPIPS